MAVLNRHIKASTLLETLVALVLILVCFSIATVVLVNIMQSDNGRMKFHARLEMESLYEKTLNQGDFLDGQAEYEQFNIQKQVKPYGTAPNLYMLELKANASSGQALGTYRRLIVIDKHAP